MPAAGDDQSYDTTGPIAEAIERAKARQAAATKKDVSHEDDRKLFVGGLENATKHEDLKEHFGQFGEVDKVKLNTDPVTGRFKGFGFVIFKDSEGFDKALIAKDQVILGRQIACKRATKKEKPGKIHLSRLPKDGITEADIREHFSDFGVVGEVCRPTDKESGEAKSFAFVTFEREEIARQLVRLGCDIVKGHKLDIKTVISKEQAATHPLGPRPPGAPAPPGQYGARPGPGQYGAPPQPPIPRGPAPGPGYGYGAGGYGAGGYGGPPAAAPGGYGPPAAAPGGYGPPAAAAGGYGPPAAAGGYAQYPGYAPYPGYGQQPVAPVKPEPARLAEFNPYDMSSYGQGGGGGKTGREGGSRPGPY